MSAKQSSWEAMANHSAAIRFIDISLRGAGQVIFQNNPLTGLFFLAAIFWGAVAAGQILIAVAAVIGLLIATLTALLLDVEETSLQQGMFGFNGILVGAALPTFLAITPSMWFLVVIGAAMSTVVMLAVSTVMKTWEVPTLTFPFVLTTWFLVLAAYSFGQLPIASMGPPSLPHALREVSVETQLGLLPVLDAWLKGPAQVFLINNAVSGVLVVIGLLVSSAWAAVFALLGSAVALALSLCLGASLGSVQAGLYGFSPVLTAVALGCVFYEPSWRISCYALLGTIFTVIVQGALNAGVSPLGIPTFTAPFVFVVWLFLLPKVKLQPQLHEHIKEPLLKKKKKHPVA